jgi:hypothetical protein
MHTKSPSLREDVLVRVSNNVPSLYISVLRLAFDAYISTLTFALSQRNRLVLAPFSDHHLSYGRCKHNSYVGQLCTHMGRHIWIRPDNLQRFLSTLQCLSVCPGALS